MTKGTKIWLAITGILLVILGIVCISKPAATLFTTAWLIGIITLISGFAKIAFTFKTQGFLPNSGSRMLSGLMHVVLGAIFLCHKFFLASSLPVIFAIWIIVEGIMIAVQSFDYKKAGFPGWWFIFLLGIGGAVLGFFGLKNPDVTASTLSALIGIAVIILGAAHLFALSGIKKLEKLM